MANDQNNRHDPGNPLTMAVGQAASVIATALTEYLGRTVQAAGGRAVENFAQDLSRGERRDPAVNAIESTFAQYRDALGDLATSLPQLAQRASLQWQAEPGMRLVFRARPTGVSGGSTGPEVWLHQAISEFDTADPVPCCWLTPQTLTGVETAVAAEAAIAAKARRTTKGLASTEKLFDDIQALLGNERRRDLPQLLDELKHAIRLDRESGLRVAQRELAELLTAPDLGRCYELLEQLEDPLGGGCLREILHSKALFTAFQGAVLDASAPALAPAKKKVPAEVIRGMEAIRRAFEGFGYVLGERLTLLRGENGRRAEYVLLDHAHDRVFSIRLGSEVLVREPPKSGREASRDRLTRPELEGYALREGRTYGIDDVCPPVRLPLRVHEASHGMAVWAVDRRELQAHINARYSGDVRMRAWDMGANRSPLALFAVHYRESDLGEYFELGLGCFVAPHRDPMAVGMMVLAKLPVSTQVSVDAGCEIWGYPKMRVEALRARYFSDRVEWTLPLSTDNLQIEVTLPRGGTRSSAKVPLLSYTQKFGQWHRSLLTRSGSGEGLRVGGRGVEIKVVQAGSTKPPKWWETNNDSTGLLALLYQFGLCGTDKNARGARASYSLWTEHMSGELGPPCLVPVPPEIEDR